jgi:signal transduction histidine kinase
VTPHQLLPLVALLLNVTLAAITLLRNAGSRLNRIFAYFVTSLAIWNGGVFMLRQSPDPATAYFWEIVIHVGLVMVPAFYYHFVLIFLDATSKRRRSLAFVYGLSALFSVLNVTGSPLFMKGVTTTVWGWAPAPGPLYLPFFLEVNAVLVLGPVLLLRARRRSMESSFRRNRAMMIVLATLVTLAGGFVDFARFIVARFVPAAEHFYPLGIPANMIFALLLGLSIVRYRLFDVSLAVRKGLAYVVAGGAVTGMVVGIARTLERYFGWDDIEVLWVVVPVGVGIALLLNPASAAMSRLMMSKRRGCHDALVTLSKRMSSILNFGKLVDTLVLGLVRGVPLTHCAVLMFDRESNTFVVAREEWATDRMGAIRPLYASSTIVRWLQREEGVLVKEEVKLNPRMAEHFEAAEGELDEVWANLIVPLKVEQNLIGILLLGEKLSGEIFDADELQLVSVLANQTAVALENARLYDELASSNVRLMQASRHKSQFLASMSHELRTPLNSVIGFSKVLMNEIDGELNPTQQTYIRSIHNSSSHLLQLINGVLDISRIEAGKLEVRREPVDLNELIDGCLASATALAQGKPVRIERDVAESLPVVEGDATKLKQILLNLLSNAVKFTAAGRVVLRVRPTPDSVHFMVADSGPGIREEDLQRIFEPFERVQNPQTAEVGGTGLGLAVSKKFVELHGGRIWAESQQHRGSTFHFTLPASTARSQEMVTA